MLCTELYSTTRAENATFLLVVSLLTASVLFPAIRLHAGIPAVRVELIIVLMAWGLLLLRQLTVSHSTKFRWNPIYKWFAFFGLAILSSMTYAYLAKGYSPIGRDFWEFGKLLEYFLLFALVASLRISPSDISRYYKIALAVFMLSALFGFAQYLNLGDINAVITPYYAPTQMSGLLRAGRIVGTTGNPNEFGALMVLASSIALSGAFFLQRRLSRFFSWICLAVFVLAIMYTISRSALIALAIALLFVLFRYATKGMKAQEFHRLLLAILLLAVIGFVDLKLTPRFFSHRTAQLSNISQATSWQARVVNWRHNISLWEQSPIFGWGPGKATMTTIADNEWILLLRRYGIVGVIVFVLWFASFYFGLGRIRRHARTEEVMALAVALQATLIAYAAYMIPAAVYHSLQLMPLLLLFLGLSYSQARTKDRTQV